MTLKLKILKQKSGDFAKDCSYLDTTEYQDLISLNTEVGKLVWYMISNPDKFM